MSARCSAASAERERASVGCSLILFSSLRRVSDCEEPESDRLECEEELYRAEEHDIVKIGIAHGV